RIISGITFDGGPQPTGDAVVFADPVGVSNVTITGDTFQNMPTSDIGIYVVKGVNNLISDNTFTGDPMVNDDRTAILFTPMSVGEHLTVRHNQISDQNDAIAANGNAADATVTVTNNTISGVHDGTANGVGIDVGKIRPTITGNTVTARSTNSANTVGIGV